MPSKIHQLLLLTLTCFWTLSTSLAGEELGLQMNEGKLFKLGNSVSEILVTNPEIADIQLTRNNSIFVYGKKPGRTHVIALNAADDVLFERRIVVDRSLAALKALIARKFNNNSIDIEASGNRILLSGTVHSSSELRNVLSLAQGYLQQGEEVVNELKFKDPYQVNLKVRIMEMNRTETEKLGINWDVLLDPGKLAINLVSGRTPISVGNRVVPGGVLEGGGASLLGQYSSNNISVNSVLDALVEEKLVKVLAEPNLTSRSGATASFFAGGEFPVPVSSGNDEIRVEFKKYGVILDMTPEVLSPDRIRLHIRPEVSELTTVGAVTFNNITIPAVAVRRTEATIELASGQSFSVAGMLQDQRRDLVNEVPWLGQLKVLGPLFRSREYQNSETELVIIATANIVRPSHETDLQNLPNAKYTRQLQRLNKPGDITENKFYRENQTSKHGGKPKLFGPGGYIF